MNNKCYICGSEIAPDRLEALWVIGVAEGLETCLKCAPTKFKKGVWAGESGTSPLIIADDVGQEGIDRYN